MDRREYRYHSEVQFVGRGGGSLEWLLIASYRALRQVGRLARQVGNIGAPAAYVI
jgi:hypothetical protein